MNLERVTKERNCNIELMRCLMMLLIVIYHCCVSGPYIDKVAVKGLSCMLYWPTDAFVFISGYYGIRLTRGKVLRLLGYGLFASMVLGLCSKWAIGTSSWRYSLGWFGNAYLAIMLVSPIVNAGLDQLKGSSRRNLDLAMLGYTGAILMNWIPLGDSFCLKVPGWLGHDFNTLLYVYVLGRYMALTGFLQTMGHKAALLGFLGMIVINLLWSVAAWTIPEGCFLKGFFVGTRNYDSPVTICTAMMIFLMFKSMKPGTSGIMKFFGYIAPSMFPIFLLHEGCNLHVSKALYGRLFDCLMSMSSAGGGG